MSEYSHESSSSFTEPSVAVTSSSLDHQAAANNDDHYNQLQQPNNDESEKTSSNHDATTTATKTTTTTTSTTLLTSQDSIGAKEESSPPSPKKQQQQDEEKTQKQKKKKSKNRSSKRKKDGSKKKKKTMTSSNSRRSSTTTTTTRRRQHHHRSSSLPTIINKGGDNDDSKHDPFGLAISKEEEEEGLVFVANGGNETKDDPKPSKDNDEVILNISRSWDERGFISGDQEDVVSSLFGPQLLTTTPAHRRSAAATNNSTESTPTTTTAASSEDLMMEFEGFEAFAEDDFDAFVEPQFVFEEDLFQQQQPFPTILEDQKPSINKNLPPTATTPVESTTAFSSSWASSASGAAAASAVSRPHHNHHIVMSANAQATAPPPLMVVQQQQPQATAVTTTKSVDVVPVMKNDFAKEQGQRFQQYLKTSGQMDEKLAVATAEAFQAFLSSHGIVPSSSLSSSKREPTASKRTTNDKIATTTGGIVLSSFLDNNDDVSSELGNSSIMGGNSDWDNGTFVSYYSSQQQNRKLPQQQQEGGQEAENNDMPEGRLTVNYPGGDEWGEIKRNESFIVARRRTSLTHNSGSTVDSEKELRGEQQQQQQETTTTLHVVEQQQQQPRPLGDYGAFVFENNSISQSFSSSASSVSTDHTTSTERTSTTFQEQWVALSQEQRDCVTSLKRKWEQQRRKKKKKKNQQQEQNGEDVSDKWYLQFARCSPGKPFTLKTALKVMKSTKHHFLDLCDDGMTEKMEQYLRTKTMFPCAGLKTKEGHDVNYVRPSRYFPAEQPVLFMKELGIYVMNHRLEKEENCTKGICVLVNMDGWTMRNFSVSYLNTMCLLIQGYTFPTRIAAFMFVDSPAWFGSIWSIMKPMLSPSFRQRVLFFKTARMPDYFAPGFEKFLPDDMYGGQANTDEVIQNFIAERKRIDAEKRSSNNNVSAAAEN